MPESHAGVPRGSCGRVEGATASSGSPGGWFGSLERPVQDGDEVVPAEPKWDLEDARFRKGANP